MRTRSKVGASLLLGLGVGGLLLTVPKCAGVPVDITKTQSMASPGGDGAQPEASPALPPPPRATPAAESESESESELAWSRPVPTLLEPPHSVAERDLQAAYESLPIGTIGYPERMMMKQGAASQVIVRVSVKEDMAVAGLPGEIVVERAKISRFTVACLIAGPADFLLVGIHGQPTDSSVCAEAGCSCLRQTLAGDEAQLGWRATPLVAGELRLHLRVAARLFLGEAHEEAHDVLSKEGVVQVDSDYWYVASGFFRTSWKELLASVGGVGAIWAFGRGVFARRKAAPRQAGFGRRQPEPAKGWVRKALQSIRP